MSSLPEFVELGPEEEARRLWKGAQRARSSAESDLVALFEVIELGVRAAEILVVSRLRSVQADFPATIAGQLDTPDPAVDTVRDAIHVPRSLGFVDLLDLLSEEASDCVSPKLHRGWEDRRFSCRRSRENARKATEITLAADDRSHLLVLAAYRNRIFRLPPPVRIAVRPIVEALDALDRLVTGLQA